MHSAVMPLTISLMRSKKWAFATGQISQLKEIIRLTSDWTTIEECLNPPVIWQDGKWFTTAPFSWSGFCIFPEL